MKKLQTVFLVSCIAATSMLTGCSEKPTYYKLSESDMSWLHYKNNQELTFAAPNGDFIQYDIVIRVKAYKVEGNTYTEFTAANISQVDDTTVVYAGDDKGLLYISKVEEGLLVTLTWPHFALKEAPINILPQSLANIGGLNYGDVMVLDASLLADNRNYFSKIWVSKSLGVLQLEDLAGNLWVRSN